MSEKVKLKDMRCSFPCLAQKDRLAEKYCISVFIPKSASEVVNAVNGAITSALKAKGLNNPSKHVLKDGDTDKYPNDANGCWVLRVMSKYEVPVFGHQRGGDGNLLEVEASSVYAGCYVNLICMTNVGTYKGVVYGNLILQAVQFNRDGKRIAPPRNKGGDFDASVDSGNVSDDF